MARQTGRVEYRKTVSLPELSPYKKACNEKVIFVFDKGENFMKKIVLLLSVILLLAGCFAGCSSQSSDEPSVLDNTLSDLEVKYNTEFGRGILLDAESWDHEMWTFECSDFPGQQVYIEMDGVENNRALAVYDNYMAYYFQDETSDYLESVFVPVFGNCLMLNVIPEKAVPSDITKETPFEEFLINNGGTIEPVVIAVVSEDGQQKAEEIERQLTEDGGAEIDAQIYFVNSLDGLDINENNVDDYLSRSDWYVDTASVHTVHIDVDPNA